METLLLRDPNFVPTPEMLEKEMGIVYPVYDQLMQTVANWGINGQWNFYNDGKAWLLKGVLKKKTVFWLSVWDDHFKVSFYFTEKNCNGLFELEIDENIKKEFVAQKPIGKLLPLVLIICNLDQLPDTLKIIEYKMKLK